MSAADNAKIQTSATLLAATQTTQTTNYRMSAQKLSSLGPPRDLSLGGRGVNILTANKKTFIPNLNVTRNKNVNVKTSRDTSGRAGSRGRSQVKIERNNSSARGGGSVGRNNSTLIQTTGLFSEGAGSVNLRKTTASVSNSYGRSSGDDSTNSLRKPVLCKTEPKFFDERDTKDQMEELIGGSDEDDLIEEKTDLHQIPIRLSNNTALDLARKQHAEELLKIQLRENQTYGEIPIYPKNVDELIQTTQQTLFIMQLPDILPCLNDEDDVDQQIDKYCSETATSSTIKTGITQRSDSIKTINDGQVGKLIRFKSGKMKLVLGESRFDITMGMQPGFLQEIMSINTNAEERNGNIINLGPIQAKLTATPDWEYILQSNQRNS